MVSSARRSRAQSGDDVDDEKKDIGCFECNICLDMACNPVLTFCGHLYCWACLYRWLHGHHQSKNSCPVCRGWLAETNITPIYGRGEVEGSELGVPPRPKAYRSRRRDHGALTSAQHTIAASIGLEPAEALAVRSEISGAGDNASASSGAAPNVGSTARTTTSRGRWRRLRRGTPRRYIPLQDHGALASAQHTIAASIGLEPAEALAVTSEISGAGDNASASSGAAPNVGSTARTTTSRGRWRRLRRGTPMRYIPLQDHGALAAVQHTIATSIRLEPAAALAVRSEISGAE